MEVDEQIVYQQRLGFLDRLKRIQTAATAASNDVSKMEEFKAKFGLASLAHKNIEKANDDYLRIILNKEQTDAVRKQELVKLKDFLTAADEIFWEIQRVYNKLFGVRQEAGKSNIHLPTLEITKFDGSHQNWPHFYDLYTALVHSNNSISDIEKFTHLLNSLKEPALAIVKAIPLSNTNYSIAFNALCQRYQNKRIIAQKYWSNISNLPEKIPNNATSIFKMLSTVSESLAALAQLELPTNEWSFILFDLIFKRLDKNLCTKFEDTRVDDSFPTYDDLRTFLENHAKALESVDMLTLRKADISADRKSSEKSSYPNSFQKSYSQKPNFQKSDRQAPYTFAQFSGGNSKQNSCPCCKAQHSLFKCDKFKSKPTEERHKFVKFNKICYNCLGSHTLRECMSNSTCKVCQNRSHHTLLHLERSRSESSSSAEPGPSSKPNSNSVSSYKTADPETNIVGTVSLNNKAQSAVLLSTAIVEIKDSEGQYQKFRAMLDNGSMCSILSSNCVQKLNLKVKSSDQKVQWLNNIKTDAVKGVTSCSFRSIQNPMCTYNVDCIVMPSICKLLPSQPLCLKDDSFIHTLSLADPNYNSPSEVDVLLGSEIYSQIMLGNIQRGDSSEPVAFETTLGWILGGRCNNLKLKNQQMHTFCAFDSDLNTTLKRFWEVENLPSKNLEAPEDRLAENHFVSTHSRDQSGRFVVSLPFKDPQPELGNSYDIALSRFFQLEKRLSKNDILRQEYVDIIRDYINSNYMSLAPSKDPKAGYYIPHHCVFKLDSTTTRTRIVFDASCKTSNGLSLNDSLLTGPKLQLDLPSILLRFRKFAIVFTADLKQMFLQILIEPKFRHYLKILWRFDKSEPIETYFLNTVTFGLCCSPFLAQRTIRQHAMNEKTAFPLAYKALMDGIYVDDVAYGCSSLGEALLMQKELLTLLKSAGFELRKWSSNNSKLLEALPEELRENKTFALDEPNSGIKILGMQWNPLTDTFSYKVNILERSCTKRNILSEIARIFDPVGFLCPLTLLAKHLMQRLWTLGLDWDEEPPSDIRATWEQYKNELPLLSSLQIPRRIVFNEVVSCHIHAFCDASQIAYASVIYFRNVLISGEIKVSLVTAKSKVAPLQNKMTIPRLELSAALLNAEMIEFISSTFAEDLPNHKIYAWTDSSIALSWIKSPPYKFKVFVANRVSQIQEKVPPQYWRHIAGTENPAADSASRGLLPRELLENSSWWSGPKWLHLPEEFWPISKISPTADEEIDAEISPTAKLSCVIVEEKHIFLQVLDRFSSFWKIQSVIAYILRFINNSKGNAKAHGIVSITELRTAMLALVKIVQEHAFCAEIEALKADKPYPKPLRKLSLFLDKENMLRVGGRLKNSSLSFENKHPLLLPRDHRLTKVLIEYFHVVHCHPGPQILNSILSQQFWILSAKRAIQHCISKCVKCFRINPKPIQPSMGNLPSSRVNQTKAFVHTGVDFAGSFTITLGKHRGAKTYKAYLSLFICFVTKAVHLEVVSDLTSEAFIAALRRFVARRGRCSHLYSDNGTNFVGADRILRGYCEDAAHNQGYQWHFNPPLSPHMGGLWERSIRSVKNLLLRTVGDQVLTFEELSTLFAQIEATLNSRPLCAMSTSPDDLRVLTPSHFLTLEPINSVPDIDLLAIPTNRLSRWNLLQQMVQSIWKRWSREYLHTLQQRSKWTQSSSSIKMHAMVLIKDDNVPPLKWVLGRVVQIHPGSDNIVRVASVRTATGIFKRPLVKLCPLPDTD